MYGFRTEANARLYSAALEEWLKTDSPSTVIYRMAARVLSRTLLRSPIVRSIYIRRSVAAGEATFPRSDLDLAMIIDSATGAEMNVLRVRYRLARAAFPRLGECQVYTQADLDESVITDPYRASIDRRGAVTVFGPPPNILPQAIAAAEAARRLVFWFEHFIPTAIRQNNQRNLHKFAVEMANAIGVLEGRWSEPLLTRRETLERSNVPDRDLLATCRDYAARAHALVRPPAPKIPHSLNLPGLDTAEVLDLMLHTQSPWIWHAHGRALAAAGFETPSDSAWRAAARRYAGGERVRGPGFLESNTQRAIARLSAAADILGGERPPLPATPVSPSVYYREYYDALAAWAAALRERAIRN